MGGGAGPRTADHLFDLAVAHHRSGRLAEAESLYRDSLALDPNHAGAMHILGRWNYEIASLGWLSKMAAKVVYGGVPPGASYEQAQEWFERAVAERPDMPLNHLWLAETLIKIHDYPRAREELQMCLDLDDVLWDDSVTKAQARKTLNEIEDKD
jgi:tetratricopeptide (TPR) repeat protein